MICVSYSTFSTRRFAFVYFADEASVDSAVENMQGSDLDGSALLLDFCGNKSQKITPKKREG